MAHRTTVLRERARESALRFASRAASAAQSRLDRTDSSNAASTETTPPPHPSQDSLEQLRRAVDSNDEEVIHRQLERFRTEVRETLEIVSPRQRRVMGRPLELESGTQSKQFMIDLLPRLQERLESYERGTVLDVLDVGCGTGHGSNLLGSLYASSELGYRLRVSAVDIDDSYRRYIRASCPYVRHFIGDIFELDSAYDFVISSHVVEHVDDPDSFCTRLQQLARDTAFVVAPFREPAHKLTKGHRRSIDHDFLERLDARRISIVNSRAWGAFADPKYEMFIAELNGLAA